MLASGFGALYISRTQIVLRKAREWVDSPPQSLACWIKAAYPVRSPNAFEASFVTTSLTLAANQSHRHNSFQIGTGVVTVISDALATNSLRSVVLGRTIELPAYLSISVLPVEDRVSGEVQTALLSGTPGQQLAHVSDLAKTRSAIGRPFFRV